MRNLVISLFVIMFMIILGACGNNNEAGTPEQNEAEPLQIHDDERVDHDQAVANVNDSKISGGIYNLVYIQAKSQLGQDVEEKDFVKEFTLETLVDQELLRQNAEELGIEVTKEEIDTEYEDHDEEQLNAFFEEYQLEEEAFKEQISFSLIHDKYIESEIDVNVSDEEVEETYDEIAEDHGEIADFEEVKDQLQEELQFEKEQKALREIVDKLKEEATIELLI